MCGSKVGESTLWEPSDQANDTLIFPFLLDKCGAISGFVQFGDCIDWEAGMVQRGGRSHVASVDVVVLNKMGSESGLAEVNSDDVIHGKPSKVCPVEPFHQLHEFNGDKLGK